MENFNDDRYGEQDNAPEEAYDARLSVVSGLLAPHRGKRLLDVGCMDGFLSRRFRKDGFYTVGLDASSRAIEKAKTVCNEAYVAHFDKLPFPVGDAYVDGVFAGEVLEHIFNTEGFLEELARVTAPGGFLVLTTPNLACWINRICLLLGWQPFFSEVGVRPGSAGNPLRQTGLTPSGHIRLFTSRSLRDILDRCGWEVVTLKGAPLLSRPGIRHIDSIISRLFPSLACDLIAYCRKKG